MRIFRPSRRLHCLGVLLLILSVGHAPLPAPDYHNVRHHDGPGEVCEHHDHLLRWHPDAGLAEDVAILHWHWFLPSGEPDRATGDDRPALHAHVADWLAPGWDEGAQLDRPDAVRSIEQLGMVPALSMAMADCAGGTQCPRARLGRIHTFSATFTPRADISSLLSRWAC
jgi:hypothetical protein